MQRTVYKDPRISPIHNSYMYMYVHRYEDWHEDWNRSLVVENVPQRESVPVQLGVCAESDNVTYNMAVFIWNNQERQVPRDRRLLVV